jgi:ribosome biogenesis GTPase
MRDRAGGRRERERKGRVVETRGRRVLVAAPDGERAVCFLAGHRAVVGDEVRWVAARGEGGKLVGVEPRRSALRRIGPHERTQVLAANLAGLLVVVTPRDPPFYAGLIDRYAVSASLEGLDVAVVVNKADLGIPPEIEASLALREAVGVAVVRVSAASGDVEPLRALLAGTIGPWALVGASGVGKTSLVRALLPDTDVGPIGEVQDGTGLGRHTTTRSRIFELPGGGEIADSPGIRTYRPALSDPTVVRDHFPGVGRLSCRYRSCMHRAGEDGCVLDAEVPGELCASYRKLLVEVIERDERLRPWIGTGQPVPEDDDEDDPFAEEPEA